MENLDDLAGLDIVLLREAGLDRKPVRGAPAKRSGWIDALVRRTAALFRETHLGRNAR